MKITPDYTGLNVQLSLNGKKKGYLREIGLAATTVAKFEKRQWVSLETLARIAYHLKCSLDDLVKFEYIETD